MCVPSVADAETCVGPYSSAGTSNTIRLGYCGGLGSLISTTYGVSSCHFINTHGISKFTSGSISDIFISYSTSSAYTTVNSTSPSSELAPTPGVSTFPMRQTCLSLKVRSLGWLLPNVMTWVITVSGMGIKSQFHRNIFLNSMPWTYIRLGDSHWDWGIFPPWFCKLGYCVGCPPYEPDITVPAVDGSDFWNIRSRLTWWSWGWDCLKFLPSSEISLAYSPCWGLYE